MKKISIILPVLLIISTYAFCQNAESLILKKGQKFLVENKVTANSNQEMMGQSMDSKANIFTSSNFEVKDVENNKYNLTNTFTKVTSSMSAMGQDMNFDSDKKEDMDGEVGSSMKSFINHPKNVSVDKTGKIIKEDNVDTADQQQSGMMGMMMNRFLGNADEAGLNTFTVLPKKATKGYSWTDSSSEEGIYKTTVYNVKDINGSEAVIAFSGMVNTDTKSQMQGMDILTKTTGILSGEETVDVKTGVIKQRTATLESKGNIEAMGQQIPLTSKLTTVTTVKGI